MTSSSQFEILGKKVGGKVYILTTLPKLLCQIHFILTFFQENYKIYVLDALWNMRLFEMGYQRIFVSQGIVVDNSGVLVLRRVNYKRMKLSVVERFYYFVRTL